jgi:hypothetical protein
MAVLNFHPPQSLRSNQATGKPCESGADECPLLYNFLVSI